MLRRLLLLQVPILKVLSDRQVSKRDDVLLDLLVYQLSLAEELVKVLGPLRWRPPSQAQNQCIIILCAANYGWPKKFFAGSH